MVSPSVRAGGHSGAGPPASADVAVIGGGPAGSAAAALLARQGWQVALLEQARFPRPHIGESLLPASMPILEELGALAAVQQADFLPKYGATMIWGRDPEPWSWRFSEASPVWPYAYQVWRPEFDRLLLENARQCGVAAWEGHRVSDVRLSDELSDAPPGPAVVRFTADDGRRGEVAARFVVDASGQSALLARRTQTRRWDAFFQNLAVYAYFIGAEPLPPPDANNILVEAYEHGWVWTIPLHTGHSSVGAVVDRRYGREGLRQLGARAFLSQQLAQTALTQRRLREARWDGAAQVVRDWSYAADRVAGPQYALAGDAACFVDPLFSSGVHLALMSGALAAAYAATALKAESSGDAALTAAAAQAYQSLYYREYRQFRELARLFYASNLTTDSYFWAARRVIGEAGGDTGYSPRHSFIQAVAGQPPRGYERVVLERGQAPAQFTDSLRAVEAGRQARRRRLAELRVDPQRLWLLAARPRLADGLGVARQAVLGAGEFTWGAALNTLSQPEGTPCSPLVAAVVRLLDGQTPVSAIVERLSPGLDAAAIGQLQTAVTNTIEILYVDGTVAEL